MTAAPREYVVTNDEQELRRLETQAGVYRPLTESVFRAAGLAPGMRVLDVGSGAGDVSFLAAELVGERGEVVGVDISPEAVEVARLEALEPQEPRFDAVVGRMVVIHQADPQEFVRRAVSHVRPGGIAAFHEIELAAGGLCHPELPLFRRLWEWVQVTCEKVGFREHLGLELVPLLHAVGLVQVEGVLSGRLDTTPGNAAQSAFVGLPRALRKQMIGLGVVTEEELGLDTLEKRLALELESTPGAVLVQSLMVGAWGRLPS